jgi:transposase-like protein
MTVRAREMAGVLHEWARSGLSQAAFARRRGIPAGTLAWWGHQLRHQGDSAPRRPGVPFVEVVALAPPAAPAPSPFEVVLGGDVTVRVPAAFDTAALRQLLGVLGRSC